jgi:hypothetical protein
LPLIPKGERNKKSMMIGEERVFPLMTKGDIVE